ncbi:RrF2 family transcriptional regulator [Heliobacterium mobile]|uniref:RrF2 family transcriptional regulator n=1 Tax=Heliobacterium mobile TaxID=28064 RepID=UPI001478D33C|nr:Rrf2 family transcriptional regulator [Heliobacterium mobile]
MKISKKTDYALRTLFTLLEYYGSSPVPIRELAKRNNIPKRFLEHIMLELKAQGWVSSIPGKNGGYILAKNPNEITVGQVIRYFDGVLAPVGCVSVAEYKKCSQEGVCKFRQLFANVRDYMVELMHQATLQKVYDGFSGEFREVRLNYMQNGDGI